MSGRELTLVLGCVLGCGNLDPGATSAASDEEMVRQTSADLRAAGDVRAISFGLDEIDVPPDVFGTTTPVVGKYAYAVASDGQGHVRGLYRFSESADGVATHYRGVLTCMGIYDFNGATSNRAKIGGRVDVSDDPTVPVGTFIWWQAIDDHSLGRPDQSTLTGFGDEAANERFCASSTPPKFGPFDVQRGFIVVEARD